MINFSEIKVFYNYHTIIHFIMRVKQALYKIKLSRGNNFLLDHTSFMMYGEL